ncbi:MAG TPA: PAS domain-containing protein [Burkholderiales bacterium]|nr:PAS domain-containing protein [Burkholderiales bacterium]
MRRLVGAYAVALLAVVVALVLRGALDPWIGRGAATITIYGAVVVAVWFGGFYPGLLAAVLGYFAANYFFSNTLFDVEGPRDVARLAGYAISNLLIIGLGGAMHAARKRAEASEARFRTFMDHAPAPVVLKDEQGRYLYMNPAGEKVAGVAPGSWSGRTDAEIFPGEAASAVQSRDRQVLQTDAAVIFSLDLQGPDGERNMLSHKFPLRDADGRRYIGTVAVDLTDLRRSQRELAEQREQLKLVTDSMAVGVVRVSRELRYLWVNAVFAHWVGRRPEDVIGRRMEEIIGEAGVRELRPHLERAQGGERVEYERLASQYRALGRRWVHAVVAPVFDAERKPDGWVTVISDVHDRRRAEEALRAAQEQLQIVVDTIPATVLRCNRDGVIVWCNAAYARWVARPKEEIVGRSLIELRGEESMREVLPYIERVRTGEQVRYERIAEFKAFGRRWVSATMTPTYEAGGGAVSGWVTVSYDIHERKLMEEALRDADRKKDEFLATLAHELRNPLAPIRNAVAILRRKNVLDPELAWSREVIERQVEQMSRLIDDLLDIARIASGKLFIRRERMTLERAIDMALETSRPNITAAGHSLSVVLPTERVLLEADPARLAQVFANLLNNAARYSEPRGAIRLSAEVEGDQVAISVEDEGIGFPSEVASQIFEPFSQFTRSNERGHGGLGIGLTLVKGIVTLHGGSVEAFSEGPGKGSQFTVRLPVVRETFRENLAPESGAADSSPPPGFRVLVADDNRDAADSLQRILAMYGYEVQVAYDGTTAIALGESYAPSVAVLDIGMPGTSGYQVARALRARFGDRVKLVALTGWGQEGDRRKALEAGFDFHLTKPVDPGVLNELLLKKGSEQFS